MQIKDYLKEKGQMVEEALRRLLPPDEGELGNHLEAMRYSLLAGGKRVRPILCLATAEALGQDPTSGLAVACALECIHTYSLIHDDLPAMDDDELRRGHPTNHMVYGEAGAILAGDGLLTFAFELLSREELAAQLPAREQLRIIQLIAKAAGPLGMVGGQALDIASENKEITFATLRSIHSRKTGALITAAVQCGAVLGQATPAQFAALTTYGEQLGLAFQIIDDLLNVEGTAAELGKAVGSDADRHKATYPAFFGVAETRAKAAQAVTAATEALTGFAHPAEPLRALAHYLLTRTR